MKLSFESAAIASGSDTLDIGFTAVPESFNKIPNRKAKGVSAKIYVRK
jgi:hypothetical protein